MVQQREGVGADGVEAAVAQYQQAREPHHHVQTETEDHVDHGQGSDIHGATRDHKRPRHGSHQQRHEEQLLLNGRPVDGWQNEFRPGDVFQRLLEQRTQQLEQEHHGSADKYPLPADVGGGIHHQLRPIQT